MPGQQRTRSLGGCVTCRTRHFKCDEVRPVCGNCRDLDIECLGYLNRITFLLDGQPDNTEDTQSRLRRPLFTEQERHAMSDELVASTGVRTTSQILTDIDIGPIEDFAEISFEKFSGPFGVFSTSKSIQQPVVAAEEQSANLQSTEFLSYDSVLENLNELWSEQPLLGGLDIEEFADIDMIGVQSPDFTEFLNRGDSHTVEPAPLVNPDRPLSTNRASGFLDHAPFLLAYYQDTIIPLLSPAANRKNLPWVSLHLRYAKEYLASMMMETEPNCAQRTVFSALLSVASYHLSATQDDPVVSESLTMTAHKYRADAFRTLKQSLQDAILIQKKAKYKEILTALLSVIDIGIFHGDFNTSQTLLLDTERFIRLRGLPKVHKSRKIRLLHHCYAFSRIIHESTASLPNGEVCMPRIFALDGSPPATPDTFRVSEWESVFDAEMTREKASELGHNDLHLEVPGRWSPTLYPDIYGVPEEFLLLLSAATRLGNEVDLANLTPGREGCTWAQFNVRAKTIEKCILRWDTSARGRPSGEDHTSGENVVPSDRPVVSAHLRGMRQALIVYFYRRVRQIDPAMLQGQVSSALQALEACRQMDTELGTCTTLFVWPAFVCACEALDLEVQDKWIRWFDASYNSSKLSKYNQAKEIAQRVWAERSSLNSKATNWMDLCRTQQMQFLCL